MKIKTEELTGRALNYAVAITEGATEEWRSDGPFFWDGIACIRINGHDTEYVPSSSWMMIGPIIDRDLIQTNPRWHNDQCAVEPSWKRLGYESEAGWHWEAHILGPENIDDPFTQTGNTATIAAARCRVLSKLGEEVEIPDELLEL